MKNFAKLFIIFSFLLSPMQIKSQAPEDDAFLEEMLKSLEQALAAEDKSDDKGDFAYPTQQSYSTEKESTDKTTKVITEYKTKTVEERFLEPDIVETEVKGGKKAQVPNTKSRKAYIEVMDKFVNQIKQLETYIDSFSPEYREIFIKKYLNKIDLIEIAHGLIKSKKGYQVIFLASAPAEKTPTKDFFKPANKTQLTELTPSQIQQLRQRIIHASKTLTLVNEKLKAASQQREKESAAKLTGYATTSDKDLKISKATTLGKQSKRHKTQVKKPTKKINPIKKNEPTVINPEPIINEIK
jgi:hypothetical protein